jgi:hypothetical protein
MTARILDLVGGAPRVGKSTLAQRLLATDGVPWLPTDVVRTVLRRVLPELDAVDQDPVDASRLAELILVGWPVQPPCVGRCVRLVPTARRVALIARVMGPSYPPDTLQLASEIVVPHAERSVQINRPPAAVFAFFADSENDPQWRPHVKEITRTAPLVRA